MTGQFAENDALAHIQLRYQEACKACEDVAIHPDWGIVAGDELGNLIQFHNDEQKLLAQTGGRPLGMDFDTSGLLIVADAVKGLLAINPLGEITLLVDQFDDMAFGLTDDVAISPDNLYYFTDATSKFDLENSFYDIAEHSGNGRLIVFDPSTSKTTLLLDNLQFANGVAVDPNGQFVLVVETASYRVQKYWLKGPQKGQSEVVIDNLPGYPDGISAGGNGIFWIALINLRDPKFEKLMNKPFWRNQVTKLFHFLGHPESIPFAMILGIDADGRIVHNLQSQSPNFYEITNVQEHDGYLYLGSLHCSGIAMYPLNSN